MRLTNRAWLHVKRNFPKKMKITDMRFWSDRRLSILSIGMSVALSVPSCIVSCLANRTAKESNCLSRVNPSIDRLKEHMGSVHAFISACGLYDGSDCDRARSIVNSMVGTSRNLQGQLEKGKILEPLQDLDVALEKADIYLKERAPSAPEAMITIARDLNNLRNPIEIAGLSGIVCR